MPVSCVIDGTNIRDFKDEVMAKDLELVRARAATACISL